MALLVIFVLVCLVSLSIAVLVCHKAHKDSDDDDKAGKSDHCDSSSASSTTTVEDDAKPRKRLVCRQTGKESGDFYSSIVSSTAPGQRPAIRPSSIEQSPYAAIGQ